LSISLQLSTLNSQPLTLNPQPSTTVASSRRSLRAVTNDQFGASLFGLVIACLITILCLGWLLFAQVDINETSSTAYIARDGSVIATFEPSIFAKLRPGQFTIMTVANSSRVWKGAVAEIANRSVNRLEPNTIRIYPTTDIPNIEIDQVKVRVATLSPLQYALRAR